MLLKIKAFFKRNLFLYTMITSLLIPDVVLRTLSRGYAVEGVRGVPALFTLLWAGLLVLALTGFMSKKWGRGLYLGVVSLFSVFMVSAYVYFRIFNQFFWLDNIGMTGQAMDYTGYIISYVDWKLILVTLLQIWLIILTCRFWRKEHFAIPGLWLVIPMLGLVTLHTFMMTDAATASKADSAALVRAKNVYRAFTDSSRSMHTAGTYQYVFRNVVRMAFPEIELDESRADVAAEYFTEKTVWEDNEMTGLLEGKNVIMVMMESIDDWMVDEKYMPTVSYMMENGIDFTNHFSCTFGTGYTFNTEFSANTGYHARSAGTPAAALSENAYPYSLANLFRAKGYSARSFHFNTPDFYNRGEMHRAFGYEEYVSFQKYMPASVAQCDSEAIANEEVYRAMVPEQENPFFDYVITYSAHLPYTYEDEKLRQIKGKYPHLLDWRMDREINHALLLAHDTDEFFRVLIENLERDGLLEDTVIVAFSDHFSYGLSSWEKMYAMGNATTSDMLEKTPFFIYGKGLEKEKIKKVTNSLDILPTIVNLFGLEKTPYWIGEDAFCPAYTGYAYFSGGSWYDGEIYYFGEENTGTRTKAVQAYVEAMNEKFSIREQVNEVVLSTDYFREE